MTATKRHSPVYPLVFIGSICLLIVFFAKQGLPVSIAYDPNHEHCLTRFHLGLLINIKPKTVERHELICFSPFGPLDYVKQKYVLKMVAGIPGDHLVIHNGLVAINNQVVARGLPLIGYYHKVASAFDKNEVIPANAYFVVGDHPLSDDSRYWGYLHKAQIIGHVMDID